MILRYAVVGIIGTLTHVSLVVLLVELANISPTLSTALGFIVVLIISYFLNRFWTFEKQNDRHLIDFIKYTLVSLFGLGLNVGIIFTTVEVLHWWYVYGLALVTLVIPVCNFLLNKYWVFKPSTS